MRTFTTLKELIDTSDFDVSMGNINSRRLHFEGQHQDFEITSELESEIVELVLDELGGWAKYRADMRRALLKRPTHWSMDRIKFVVRPDGIKAKYITGQDGTTEYPLIRKVLRNL